jgi:alkylhydroperoxidase family enzyme
MARLPYADENANAESRALAARIRAERGGKLLNLYRMLLASPPVAEGWLAFLSAIRQRCRLGGAIRELAILRIAIVNGAAYEHAAHVPFALGEGISRSQIDALSDWRGAALFDPAQRAALAFVDAMTEDVHVPDAIFDALRPHFSPREIVELTATVAAYNCVSRFLEALAIDPEGRPG